MSDKFYLIPKPGLVVRDPDTAQPLPSEGAEKPKTGYWFRRLMEGDVTESDQRSAGATTPPEPRAVNDVQEAQVSRAHGSAGATEAPARAATKNKPTKE